jgi:hypothetical protein
MIQSIWVKVHNINIQPVLRFSVTLAVLLFSIYSGTHASISLLTLVGIIILGGFLSISLTRKPEYGVVAIFPISFFLRSVIGTGTNVQLNFTIIWIALIIGLWIMRMIVIDRKIILISSRTTILAILFCLSVIVSFIAGNLQLVPLASDSASLQAQIGGGLIYILSIGTFLYVGHQFRELSWLKYSTWIFISISSFYLICRVLLLPENISSRIFNDTIASGSMFWNWFVALAAGQLIFNKHLRWLVKMILITFILASLYIGWFQAREWVSGWLPPLVAIMVIIFLRNWRVGLVLALVGILIIAFNFSTLNTEVMTSSQQYSIESRSWTLPILFQLIKYDPIFGLGPANYYHYTPLYSINGYYVEFNSHNNYVDIVAQIGLVGLVLFAWLVIEISYLAWRLRKRVQDNFSLGYIHACLGGLAGMVVSGFMGDWFLPFLYNIGIPGFRVSVFAWLFLGGLVALERMMDE